MKLKILVGLSVIALCTLFSPAAPAQTYSVIHTFTGPDGAGPLQMTLRGSVLYGVTDFRVENQGPDYSVVYQLTLGSWAFDPLFLFPGQNAGAYTGGVSFGPEGHLYGAASDAQNTEAIFYDLVPPISVCRTVNCGWKENVLDTFSGVNGYSPSTWGLVWDQQGNAYGATSEGGNADLGTVYELTKSGNAWTETVLHSFSGIDGELPEGVTLDNNGNVFGTTQQGGTHRVGVVFELQNVPGVGWQETVIHNIAGGAEGEVPGGVLFDKSSGNLYGTTIQGGSGGGGTIFELSPSGNSWTYTVLYSFSGSSGGSVLGLTMDTAGNLYGTTTRDGAHQQGNVFKLSNTPNGWVYTSLYDFTGGSDGGQPITYVNIDTDGTLYGTASQGGTYDGNCVTYHGCGVVWMIKP